MKKIIFSLLVFCISLSADCTSNNNGTTSCSDTGLMWQDSKITAKTWAEALKYCHNLELSGHKDWRLPNINELLSIANFKQNGNITKSGFSTQGYGYWSSTTNANFDQSAWFIDFNSASVTADLKTLEKSIRCVR